MRTIFLAIFFFLDLALFGQALQSTSTYNIPSAGSVVSLYPYQVSKQIKVTCNGATTLSSGYTLQYTSLPSVGQGWTVYCDFTNLTPSGQTVSIFGVTPLTKYPGLTTLTLYFWVDFDATGTPVLNSTFVSQLFAGNFNTLAVFNDGFKSYGTSQYQPGGSITPGSVLKTSDDSGTLAYGCVPWCDNGNAGLNGSTNFIGTTDTASLSFRVDNLPSGILSYNLNNTGIGLYSLHNNTSGTENTAFGRLSLQSNTTGAENTGIGVGSLSANTTGGFNASLGYNSLVDNTTGVYNAAIGYYALPNITTGNYNTGVGQGAGTSMGTGIYNTFLGANTVANASNINYSVALGALATIYSSNQLAISPNIQNILWQGHPSALGAVVSDSTGNGNLILTANIIPLDSAQIVAIVSPKVGQTFFCTNCSNNSFNNGLNAQWTGSLWRKW
jgi:hypothetical protein